MKDDTFVNSKDGYLRKILKDNFIINEVDFERDIDIDKCNDIKYLINYKEGYICFLYRVIENIGIKDMTLIAEEVHETEGSGLLPKPYSLKNSNYICDNSFNDKYNHYFYEKNISEYINEKINFVVLQQNYNSQGIVCFCNQPNIDILNIVNNAEENIKKTMMANKKTEGALVYLSGGTICNINIYNSDKYNIDDQISLISKNSIIDILVDLAKGNVIAVDENSRKLTADISNYLNTEKINLFYSIKASMLKKNQTINNFDKIVLGTDTGYIYLKPIKIRFNQVKVIVMCTGNSEIEYFNSQKKLWCLLEYDYGIQSENEVLLRIKCNSFDRIWGIYFVVPNDIFGNRRYRSLDIFKELDVMKSDKYQVNDFKGYLTFLYRKVMNLNINDFDVIIGDMTLENNKIKIMQKENDIFNDKRFICISKNPINLRNDEELMIQFYKNEGSMFSYSIVDRCNKQMWEKIKNGNMFDNSMDAYKLYLWFYNKRICIYKKQKQLLAELLYDNHVSELRHDELLNVSMDLNRGKFTLDNGQKLICSFRSSEETINNEDTYLNIIYKSNKGNKKDYINKIAIINRSGYVYTKEIISTFSCSIMVITSDSLKETNLEYTIDNSEWKQYTDEIIKKDSRIRLRVLINSYERIYFIGLIEYKE